MANNIQARFISADDHIDLRWLPKDLWTERLPAKLRERGPRVVETDKGECWTWEGQTFSPHGYYTAAQGSGAMWAIERGGVMREGELRPTSASLRLGDMDRDGADASIMYGPTDPMAIADPELRRRCYEAYNDWLAEFCAAKPERLIGVAQLRKFRKTDRRCLSPRTSSLNFCQYFCQPHVRKTQSVAFVRIESGKSSILFFDDSQSEEFRQKIDTLRDKRICADR
jgi:hypothetical protein